MGEMVYRGRVRTIHFSKLPALQWATSGYTTPTTAPIAEFCVPVGVNGGVKSSTDSRKPLIYGPGPSRKPDSALSRHPSPGFWCPGLLSEEPRLPARLPSSRAPGQFGLLAPVVYLAGPSRDTAGGLLPHPFTHHLCRTGSSPLRPSAGLLSVALDVAAGLRRAAPRVLSPSGLCGREKRALASPDFALRTGLVEAGSQRRVGRPRPASILYPRY